MLRTTYKSVIIASTRTLRSNEKAARWTSEERIHTRHQASSQRGGGRGKNKDPHGRDKLMHSTLRVLLTKTKTEEEDERRRWQENEKTSCWRKGDSRVKRRVQGLRGTGRSITPKLDQLTGKVWLWLARMVFLCFHSAQSYVVSVNRTTSNLKIFPDSFSVKHIQFENIPWQQ